MNTETKGNSPFYPGQPVPSELFVGRYGQIDHILKRGVGQVKAGKPIALYVQGEYGIGKTSIAKFVQRVAERDYGLHSIYTTLGGVKSIDGIGSAVLKSTVQSGALNPERSAKIRNWLAKYIGAQSLFGLTLHAEALKKDGPDIGGGMLPFLSETLSQLKGTGAKGIFLVLDEINGIAENPDFAYFIKNLIDTNAVSDKPLPLLLMLCGVEDRRIEMIKRHQPIERIFDVIDIEVMSDNEMEDFFTKAFDSVNIKVNKNALHSLTFYSAGLPKIMHLIGDHAYWIDGDNLISESDADGATLKTAEAVGRNFVDQQVINALRSKAYKSILRKIGKISLKESFYKADIAKGLSETEKKKLNNFLQRMKKLKVLRSGDNIGEYVFINRMVSIYIWLHSRRSSNL